MTHVPVWKRLQGDHHYGFASEEERFSAYQENHITHGVVGSVTENDVLEKLNAIRNSGESDDNKLDMLEALHWYTVNNVEHGGVSDALEEVDKETRRILQG